MRGRCLADWRHPVTPAHRTGLPLVHGIARIQGAAQSAFALALGSQTFSSG